MEVGRPRPCSKTRWCGFMWSEHSSMQTAELVLCATSRSDEESLNLWITCSDSWLRSTMHVGEGPLSRDNCETNFSKHLIHAWFQGDWDICKRLVCNVQAVTKPAVRGSSRLFVAGIRDDPARPQGPFFLMLRPISASLVVDFGTQE